jgi:integrase
MTTTQKRRSAGEGNIRQRADGRWEARVDLGSVNGERLVKSVYGATRAAVVKKLREVQQAQQQGLDLSADQLTVDAFLQHWLEHTVKLKNRVRTYADYCGAVRR